MRGIIKLASMIRRKKDSFATRDSKTISSQIAMPTCANPFFTYAGTSSSSVCSEFYLLPTLVTTIMISLAALVLALPIIASVSALTLNAPTLMLASTAVTNVTRANYVHQCNKRDYGENLNIARCLEALDQIDDHSTVEQSYGERYKGVFDVKLPVRYISCWLPLSS